MAYKLGDSYMALIGKSSEYMKATVSCLILHESVFDLAFSRVVSLTAPD